MPKVNQKELQKLVNPVKVRRERLTWEDRKDVEDVNFWQRFEEDMLRQDVVIKKGGR